MNADQKSLQKDDPIALARRLGEILLARGLKLVTAESCTGGGLGAAVTAIPGSSRWYEGGYVTYSNAMKQDLMGVRPDTLQHYGAVSGETAAEMAQGALQRTGTDLSVAITGIAGPDGGTFDKPIGTVWIAIARRGQPAASQHHQFFGDRETIRRSAVLNALLSLIDVLIK